jgi:virulence factor
MQIDDMLRDKIDAAMVHSSTESHFKIVMQLLSAGIPTFVDKPLSLSFKESEELLNLSLQKQVTLYVGFNRRFAPLVQDLTKETRAKQINWVKNRINQPEIARNFVFNDFIHVIDSLRFLGVGKLSDLQVYSQVKNGLLETINVQWQQNETRLNGYMNRVSGCTEERIEYYTLGNKWLLEELDLGWHYENGSPRRLQFDHWESTLYKRGFVTMIDDWLSVLQDKNFNAERIHDIWETHQLCERIVTSC